MMIATRLVRGLIGVIALSPFTGLAMAQQAALTKIEVFPPEIQLATAADRQSVVVQATYADGITRDVTTEAGFTLADATLVRRDGATFYPLADGATTLTVAFGGRSETRPVKVAQA